MNDVAVQDSPPDNIVPFDDGVMKRLVAEAITVAPAKYHRPFRKTIEGWIGSLNQKDRLILVMQWRRRPKKDSLKIARDMFEIFLQQEKSHGSLGS